MYFEVEAKLLSWGWSFKWKLKLEALSWGWVLMLNFEDKLNVVHDWQMTPTPEWSDPNYTGDEARPAESASISSSWVCGVRSVIGLKDNFSANIVVGDSFNFSFRNLDVVHTVKF